MNQPHQGYIVDRSLRLFADNTALIDGDSGATMTYRQLATAIDAFASDLQRCGVKSGDRVAALAGNSCEYIALFFAAWKSGAIFVPLNVRLSAGELESILSDCQPAVVYADDHHQGMLLRSDVPVKPLALPETVGRESKSVPLKDDICMILYTSGSTGTPKGAMLSASMIHWNAINTHHRINLTANDRTVSFLPMFHTGGWHVLTTPLLMHGGSVVVCKKFDAGDVLKMTNTFKPTIVLGVPTTMAMLARHQEFAQTDFSSVRFALVGGEPMPVPEIECWHGRGVPIRQGYGLTEFGPNVFSLPAEDAIRKIGSIGLPNYFIDVRLEEGELWLRGPMAFSGYYGNAEATVSTLTSGWVKTGDILSQDSDGYFYVVGRKKDMFISGGENVYPAEIEVVLKKHPGVVEVAVVGTSDQKWGEVGHAFVSSCSELPPDALTTQLRQLCQDNLARYKQPAFYTLLPDLPKLASGKIDKKKLREQLLGA